MFNFKNDLYASHPIVIVIKLTTFLQPNTTHIYYINLKALTYFLRVWPILRQYSGMSAQDNNEEDKSKI